MMHKRNLSGKNSRYEIRIAGSGGQGIILAGIILAEAAILDGKYVTQSQNYGPETRGGTSVSEVILSDMEVDYPKAMELDLLVALTQEACDQTLPALKREGLVVVDSDLVQRVLWRRLATLPFQQIAQKAGEERAINMAALGAIAAFSTEISSASLKRVMAKRLPSANLVVNRRAFGQALKIARNLRKSLKSAGTEEEFEI